MIVKPEAVTADFSTLQEAPCFTPTHDEFKDPLKYIASIRRDAEPYGICKIRPPKGWKPPFAQHQDVLKFQTKKQELRTLEGRGRLRLRFEEALRKFMFAIGKPMPSVLKAEHHAHKGNPHRAAVRQQLSSCVDSTLGQLAAAFCALWWHALALVAAHGYFA
eukprot:15448-Heterococcus_DN1.PRE.2